MKYVLLIALLFFSPMLCEAQQDTPTLDLASPISDHMVLQQGKPTSIWGTANAGSTVTVNFGDQNLQTITDADGHWKLTPVSYTHLTLPTIYSV